MGQCPYQASLITPCRKEGKGKREIQRRNMVEIVQSKVKEEEKQEQNGGRENAVPKSTQ